MFYRLQNTFTQSHPYCRQKGPELDIWTIHDHLSGLARNLMSWPLCIVTATCEQTVIMNMSHTGNLKPRVYASHPRIHETNDWPSISPQVSQLKAWTFLTSHCKAPSHWWRKHPGQSGCSHTAVRTPLALLSLTLQPLVRHLIPTEGIVMLQWAEPFALQVISQKSTGIDSRSKRPSKNWTIQQAASFMTASNMVFGVTCFWKTLPTEISLESSSQNTSSPS